MPGNNLFGQEMSVLFPECAKVSIFSDIIILLLLYIRFETIIYCPIYAGVQIFLPGIAGFT